MPIRRSDLRLALALALVLTFFFWLTGHNWIESYDGEAVFLVTESLVERGTFAVPEPQPDDVPRAVVQAPDGRHFSVTPPLQSVLAVPFYVVGRWAGGFFPAPFTAYFTRFFATLLNGAVHAGAVALLYLFGVDLGYRRRTALFVAAAYGLATVGWPYGGTFFSETLHTFWLVLAAWAVYRYARTERWPWLALGGAAMGFGFLSKYVMAVAGPAFALYLLWVWWRRRGAPDLAVRSVRMVLSFGVPLLLLVGAAMAFNHVRFGSVWETGYTMEQARGSFTSWGREAEPLVSWFGFFLSPGKGFLLFSPITILLLWSVVPAARRFRERGILALFLMVCASYPLFYSVITYRWFGGANWGPRYIVCITPFALLPVGAYLERRGLPQWLRHGSAVGLFVVGFWIQLSVVLTAPAYLASAVPFGEQLYHPRHSTLLEQWRLWPERTRTWLAYDLEAREHPPFYWFAGELYDVEVPAQRPYGRWMEEEVWFYIYPPPDRPIEVRFEYSYPREKEIASGSWEGLDLTYDGIPLENSLRQVAADGDAVQWRQTVTIPPGDVQKYPGTLTAAADAGPVAGDERDLGVFLSGVMITAGGMPVPHREVALPWPLPVSRADLWSDAAKFWFHDPRIARPLNVWPWYLSLTGVPLAQVRRFTVLWGGALGAGLIVSGVLLRHALRRALRS